MARPVVVCLLSALCAREAGAQVILDTVDATWVVATDTSSLAVGDVNGDGWQDVIVGDEWVDSGVLDLVGAVRVYLGSAVGPSAAPGWTRSGTRDNQLLGTSVAAADVNGDGCDDVVVGSPGWAGYDGKADLYLGSPAGLPANPSWTFVAPDPLSHLGASVARAGDVDGDGFDDVLIGAPWQGSTGAALLFLGSGGGLGAAPSWTGSGPGPESELGATVAGAGDVDGDGYDDVAAGAPGVGRALLWLGSPAGPAAAAAWEEPGGPGRFGDALAAAGDVDGDGRDDLVVGAPQLNHDGASRVGAAYVYRGSPGGLEQDPAWTRRGIDPGEELGLSVAGAGDWNGDGRDDVAVATRFNGAFLHFGWSGGLQGAHAVLCGGNALRVAGAGDVDHDGFDDLLVGRGTLELYEGGPLPDTDGDEAVDAHDVCPAVPDPVQLDDDADGLGNACDDPTSLEVVGVVSSGASVELVARGASPSEQVDFYGAVGGGGAGPCPGSLGGVCLDLGPVAPRLGAAVADAAGVATLPVLVPQVVAPGGTYTVQAAIPRGPGGAGSVTSEPLVLDPSVLDWDADGLVDAAEAAWGSDPRLGDTDGDGLLDLEDTRPFLDPNDPDTDGDGVVNGADVCVADDDAADVDGDLVADGCDTCPADADPLQADADADGLGDACEGAVVVEPAFTDDSDRQGHLLGAAVAPAGDITADGYDDVLVGAPGANAGSGGVYLYKGSVNGPWRVTWRWLSPWAGSAAGQSVAGAGDVNGDGYSDILVGLPKYQGGQRDEGAAAVFLGSPLGLPWMAPDWFVESDVADAELGHVVSWAGDVDGDGYDDVVAGTWRQIRLYRGSAAGLSAAATTVPAPSVVSLAGVGDVNGDGFTDVVVGGANEAHLHLGGPTGLESAPAWSATGQGWVGFGDRVAGAGDVNGDGFADVLVGAPYEGSGGSAHLYLGSARGLSPTPDWSRAYGQRGAAFGTGLAGVGDVNGDGYDDLLLGAPDFDDDDHAMEGAVSLHLGSAEGPAAAAAWTGQSGTDAVCGGGYYGCLTTGYGQEVAGAGDVNGDGLADLVVGAHSVRAPTDREGRVYVYRGASP